VAPVCSNCNGTDFVWANELKTGMTGGGTLSLRSRGEIPLGTRICRTCGHADLFLRDISILHQPHVWRPGEFIPIVPKPVPKPATHASSHAPPAPAAPAPPAPPPPAPPEPAPVPVPEPAAMPPPDPVPEPPMMAEPESPPSSDAAPTDEAPAKPRSPRRRTPKSKPSG
jgi:hypothetical protein